MANDPMLEMYVVESVQLTERLEEILMEGEHLGGFNTEHINEIFRIMHTIKGSAAMMEYTQISTLAHSLEDMFFYIREHDDAAPDWAEIADICLNACDFFKGEIAKISSRLPSDGDMSALLDRCKGCLSVLSGKTSEPAAPGIDKAAKPAVTAPAQASSGNAFMARVFFEEGCKMENIRAYQIVNALTDLSDSIETYPSDLLEDCSDAIIANGVTITIRTGTHIDKLRAVIGEALFVKSFDISPIDIEQTSPQPMPEAAAVEEAQIKAAENKEKAKNGSASTAEEAASAPASESPEPAQASVPAPVVKSASAPPAALPAEIKQNFINVNVDKLDKLMDLMGEIVISVSMVVGNPDLAGLKLDNFEKSASQLLKNTSELQEVIMSVRMIPISSTFHKMNRIVRDTSKKLNKEVELVILGEETEVDKTIIDNLSDPLMHIIRNSLDHGLEADKDRRLAAGKRPVGRIVLEARNSGSDVIITCADDGRGLDRDRILAKAMRNGLLTRPENEYTDKEIYQFIMLPGFSTNEQVTELSGRGVGMDVVKKNIEKVGGSVMLDSVAGQGMTVTIRIPLTLAILASIEIKVGKNLYLIPTLNIREAFRPKKDDIIVDPDGNEMILFRGECYPIVRLHRLFRVATDVQSFEAGIIIMIEDEGRMAGIFADEMVSEQQAVVKPIPSFITERIGQIRGISGCTIMGNGNIDLIVDVKNLTQ